MALYPNGSNSAAGYLLNIGSYGPLTQFNERSFWRINNFTELPPTSSFPEGSAPTAAGWLPIKAGGMAGRAQISLSGEGNLLQGGPMAGTGSITFTSADASLGLIVSMTGTGTINWTTPNGLLSLTIGMGGNGSFSLTGSGGLSMIVPFEGTGSWALTGAGDLKGRLSMEGEWTPYTELSPENLARSVWEAVASQYTDGTTMGGKLNTASSGGVDLNALAQAVWEYATRTLTSGGAGGMTTEQATQLAELWRMQGLDPASPLHVTPTSRTAGAISQAISGDGETSSTVTRV